MKCKHCKRSIIYNFDIWRWTTGKLNRMGVYCPKHRHYDDDGTLMDHNLCHEPDLQTRGESLVAA